MTKREEQEALGKEAAKDMSTREIEACFKEMYGTDIYPDIQSHQIRY